MTLPRSTRSTWQLGLAALVVLIFAIAAVDYVRFENACRRLIETAASAGGHAYSLGGRPTGREFLIRFDRSISSDAVQRIAATVPNSRRISVTLAFRCEMPPTRLAQLREMTAAHGVEIVALGEEDAPAL